MDSDAVSNFINTESCVTRFAFDSISDGMIAFQASIMVADGVVLNLVHYKNGLGMNEGKGLSAYTYLETEVSVAPRIDSEVVIQYKSSGKVSEGGLGAWWRGETREFLVDDGLTISKKDYDSNFPTSSNYMPLSFSAGWRAREGKSSHLPAEGENKGYGMTIVGGQALGVCGFEDDLIEVMVSRSLSGDDQKGMGEALVEDRRTSALVAVLLGNEKDISQGGGETYDEVFEREKPILTTRFFC